MCERTRCLRLRREPDDILKKKSADLGRNEELVLQSVLLINVRFRIIVKVVEKYRLDLSFSYGISMKR